jgi:hypothetical protein
MQLGIGELPEFPDDVKFEWELLTDALIGLDNHPGQGWPAVRIPMVRIQGSGRGKAAVVTARLGVLEHRHP